VLRNPPMKLQAKKGAFAASICYQFRLRPDNLVRVEVSGSRVIIRSSATLPVTQRTAFIRYLIQEGFVPDRSICRTATKHDCPVDWVTRKRPAQGLPEATPWIERRANSWMLRLLGCALVVWVTELAILLLKS